MNKAAPLIYTKEEILSHYDYDKSTGILTRKKTGRSSKNAGYLTITIGYVIYSAHRIVWFLEKNEWPDVIDHINGDIHDNRIENLRACTIRENQQNRKSHRTGRLQGATWNKKDRCWRAAIKENGKSRSLGTFGSEKDAHEAYKREVEKLKAKAL